MSDKQSNQTPEPHSPGPGEGHGTPLSDPPINPEKQARMRKIYERLWFEKVNAEDAMFGWADMPPFKSPAFMEMLEAQGMSLEQFRKQPEYEVAVRAGQIVDDEWVEEQDALPE